MPKELEDYNWFPARLRRWQMDFIGFVVTFLNLYKPIVPVLQQMIDGNDISVLQDTCSGSGIPAVYVHNRLSNKLQMLLTDKFPETKFKNNASVVYLPSSVDLIEIEPSRNTLYTMFNAFHHFNEGQQKSFVKKMVENNNPFLITEIIEPNLFTGFKVLLTTLVLQLMFTPFLKPFSPLRLFFTYLVPVNLFTITYDGMVSLFKSKSVSQYRKLLYSFSSIDFEVSVNHFSNWKGSVVYIRGNPIKK